MKKTKTQSYRLSEERKEQLELISSRIKIPPSLIVTTLVEQYIDALEEHGDRLVWPPRFTYYEADARTSQDKPDTNDTPAELAG